MRTRRDAPLEIDPDQFRKLGHEAVDRIAEFLRELPRRRVTPGETPEEVRAALGGGGLPQHGAPLAELLEESWRLIADHSLLSGHPRFSGYVTSSGSPLGALADLMAAAINPNTRAWVLAPIASEIEAQAVRWIGEFIGYGASSPGLLVSGGSAANYIGFLAARRAKADWDVRAEGASRPAGGRLTAYASTETHTWIQKAADAFGLGTGSIRWIPVDASFRTRVPELRTAIESDVAAGNRPFLIVGTAGTVSTGAIDPLPEMAAVAREYGLWFHVDGAYGAAAAALPEAGEDLRGLREADSVAVDPHKWMYVPMEAGCALVRDHRFLLDTFSFSPSYYWSEGAPGDEAVNYYAYGPQNSRGFRALKVWLALRAAGREGLVKMISDDIALAEALDAELRRHPEIEPLARGLSINTFRYAPRDIDRADPASLQYLNRLNQSLLERLQKSGEAFLSNAVIEGKFALRSCVVNFRTTLDDIQALPPLILRTGAEADQALRGAAPATGRN